ncbi:MAG: rhodanese-like domain-containing protein [Ignavibacteria bacterium]
MSKTTLKEIVIILAIVLGVGILFNLSSPNRLLFIGEEKSVDYAKSDSLMLALQKQDSIQHAADSIKNLSIKREDSLKILNEKRSKDSLLVVLKQDSLKRVSDSLRTVKKKSEDSLKSVKEEEDNFVKPIDIRIDFAKALYDRKYTFIDARDDADYEAGTILGAKSYPFHKFDQIKDKISKLSKNDVYVCFCSSACDVSIDMAYAMAHMGFTKMYIFHGGWDEWKKAGYPTSK